LTEREIRGREEGGKREGRRKREAEGGKREGRGERKRKRIEEVEAGGRMEGGGKGEGKGNFCSLDPLPRFYFLSSTGWRQDARRVYRPRGGGLASRGCVIYSR
jgi:hypothetical protein